MGSSMTAHTDAYWRKRIARLEAERNALAALLVPLPVVEENETPPEFCSEFCQRFHRALVEYVEELAE